MADKKDNTEYRALRESLKQGSFKPLYVIFGEESYLKRHCLSELKKLVCGAFDEFNYEFLEGEGLKPDVLEDAVCTLPMGSTHKLVVVRDLKLMPPPAAFKDFLPEFLDGLPGHVCLVFLFEGTEFKPDKRLSIYKTLEARSSMVEFNYPSAGDLSVWLRRRFSALGKQIGAADCERLLFLCGYSMTNLATEVDKIAAATSGQTVTRGDIDALASRVLEADVFELTDAVLDGGYKRALVILRDLLDMQSEPVAIMAALTRQLQRLYGAKLARAARMSESETAKLLGLRSSYPARLMLEKSSRTGLEMLRRAQQKCLDFDVLLKSSVPDQGRTLEIFLMQLAQEAADDKAQAGSGR